jgi:hypothetical protein
MARSQKLPTTDKLRVYAAARGYKRGTYIEKNKIRKKRIYNSIIIKNQDTTLYRYVLYIILFFTLYFFLFSDDYTLRG